MHVGTGRVAGAAYLPDHLAAAHCLALFHIDVAHVVVGGLQAVAVAPQSGRAWMLVGSAYESLGDTASAYDAYSQASTVSEETDPQITAIARMRMAGMLQAIQAPSEITPEP